MPRRLFNRIVSGVDRQASELAIPRLKRECRIIEDRIADEWRYIERAERWEGRKTGNALTRAIVVGVVLSMCGLVFHWALSPFSLIATVALCAQFVYLSLPDRRKVGEGHPGNQRPN